MVSLDTLRSAIDQQVGRPLGIEPIAAAGAVIRVANDRMAGAIRMVSLARGYDPRDFCLLAFGGAGPLHATALARELSIPDVLIPTRPGLTNALGCLVADLRHDFVTTLNRPLATLREGAILSVFAEHVAQGRALIEKEKIRDFATRAYHKADLQFQGQSHVLGVSLPDENVTIDQLSKLFAKAYWERFQVELSELRPVLVNLHTAVVGERRPLPLDAIMPTGTKDAKIRLAKRPVWFNGAWIDTPIYQREQLTRGHQFSGPAIIEQLDATTVIEPEDRARVDSCGNLVIEIGRNA